MKHTQFHTLTILIVSLFVFTACSKKDREPTLIVTVKDANSVPLQGAYVHVWPTDDVNSDSINDGSGVSNERMDRRGLTDSKGEIELEFPASAVLDVDVNYVLGTDTLKGHKVVKIEVIRQKDEENIFSEVVFVE